MRAKFTEEEMKSQKFGLLTPIRSTRRGRKKFWYCKCDCGKIVERPQSYLVYKKRNFSCGCANRYIQPGGVTRDSHHGWKGCGELDGQYFSEMRCRARKQKIDFSITIEEAWEQFEKQRGKCSLTGLSLNFETHRMKKLGHAQTASLDRKDSNKGYVVGNIQWVHKDINRMKNAYDEDHYIRMCCLVADLHRAKEAQLATSA